MCNRLNIRLLLVISCSQWFKDTKMRANHNWYEPIAQTEDAVSNGSKILNLNKTLSDFPTILYLYTLFFIHEY